MKVLEQIQIVERYQKTGHVHELLCGENAAHPLLIPRVGSNGECEIFCPEKGCAHCRTVSIKECQNFQAMIDADPKKLLKLA
ncbi:MAG: hypothetical protein CMI52_05270 [Parcubacteria group bacterium]|nr:hypothetical protein [Parcubacteria group bacterium]|tara:strand:+ start:418 stop:663 length:246 start_codon:yes stop_codon:yes gene_type:complete